MLKDKLDRSQIILALKVIQRECKNHGNCEDDCPFKKDICLVTERPRDWVINDDEKWQALR